MKTSQPTEINISNGRMRIFTGQTTPPAKDTLKGHSKIYMEAFNGPPWDVYDWRIFPEEKGLNEFTKIVSTIFAEGGSLISLETDGNPIGFNIITDLSIFVKRLTEVESFKRLPRNFKNPQKYLQKLSGLINTPVSDFVRVGYLADICVDKRYRGQGYGKALVDAGLKYLVSAHKQSVVAWSINPSMEKILSGNGFKPIVGIGQDGDGIDFCVHGKVWYPTLSVPPKRRKTTVDIKVAANHYFRNIGRRLQPCY
jgi:ribosomal protein S18 acetylase RimI-like enzyme